MISEQGRIVVGADASRAAVETCRHEAPGASDDPSLDRLSMSDTSFRRTLLPMLQCPSCRGAFDFVETACPDLGAGEFGILECGCRRYPVIDGIPIVQPTAVGMFEHTRGTMQVEGTSIDRLVELVETGRGLEALLRCIVAASPPGIAWRTLVGWRRSAGIARRLAESNFKRRVLARRASIGGRDVLEFYYLRGGPLDPRMGHYFIRRFATPRHLAALSLAATVPVDPRPVLDVASGIGTLAHYFTNRVDRTRVVGVDMNFYHLWLAKHWMAPLAHHVCANASEPLPFTDAAFSSVFCSDAYHYFKPSRAPFLREVERCAPRRMVVLTRVGNKSVMPNEGAEATLDDYLAEFNIASPRAFVEEELVGAYLRRENPFSSTPKPLADVAASKWLSFAWHANAGQMQSRVEDERAHAVGEIGWNPIYRRTALANGDLRLTFEFPVPWYAYENHAMLEYHPIEATVPRSSVEGLRNWRSDELLKTLVDSFVLVGLPLRFRSTGPVGGPPPPTFADRRPARNNAG